ncbi:MAG: DUF1631 family protein [Pseudomonas sp.]
MEKRRWPRKASELNALLSLGLDVNCRCVIRDFSQVGMLVSFDDLVLARIKRSALNTPERPASICLELPDRSVAMDVEVARFTEQGAGLRLLSPNPSYFAALQEAAQLTRASSNQASRRILANQGQLDTDSKRQLTRNANQCFKTFLEDHFASFTGQLETALLVQADKQKTSSQQQTFFDAIALLRKQQQRVLSATVNRISETALDLAQGRLLPDQLAAQTEGKSKTLELVEKDEFEDWLVVRVAISRAELQYRDSLIELQLRIEAAFGNSSSNRTFNPYSPSSLCNTLFEVIRHLGLKGRVVEVVFAVLQDSILTELDPVYRELNQLFVSTNVLPNLDVGQYLASQAQQSRPQRAAPAVRAAETATEELPDLTQQPAAEGSVETQAAATQTIDAQAAFGAVARLLSLQRQLNPGLQAEPMNDLSGPVGDGSAAPTLQALEQLQQAVLQGSVSLAAPGATRQWLRQAGNLRPAMSEFELDSMEMVEQLFERIVSSTRIATDLREELRKLQLPMMQALLKDPSLFNNENHPARQAVNHLALLADQGSINLENNRGTIRSSIENILAHQDSTQGFADSLTTLDSLASKERRFIEHNLKRIRETCAGQQRLIQANRQIERELGQLLARPVPEQLLNLINHGWKDLMRLSYLREGISSSSWKMSLALLNHLLWHLVPESNVQGNTPHAPEHLMRLITRGLTKVPEGNMSHELIAEQLEQVLQTGVQPDTAHGLYSSVELDSSVLEARLAAQVETDKELMRWIKRARNLKVSEWFDLIQPGQAAQHYQLVWMADDASQFMFANHHGTKTAGMALEQVAVMLRDGGLEPLHDNLLPAMEQGIEGVVKNVYDQLAFDSSHDQLTGLLTRKEFCRQLAQAVSRAQEHDQAHSLIFIDIQQFKVINNTCGYEVGDRFLEELGGRISSVAGEQAIVGRVGPDQFALVLPLEADRAGYRLAAELKASIEDTRFVHESQSFVIQTVFAMLGFDQQNHKVMDLLRSVETAAGLAKRSGHKEIQLIMPGDGRLDELDEVMVWVTRINRALDEGNLKLRCQKIAPLAAGALPHYEVLLTVIDDQGEHMPPADFIKVAEDYNRMGAVDRWVIENVLRWMMEHQDQLHLFGGFSINLSGHSMNDERFLDFIFDALVRYQVPRDKLIFEITETTAVANLEDAADFISEMRSIGCRFSLDDFGVGQSSYTYLKRLPVDFIKIDGAFVRDITRSEVDFALVKSITEMGHYLNKQVIAEYVSSTEILETVTAIGVDYAQGHVHGRPGMLEQLNLKAVQASPSDSAPA